MSRRHRKYHFSSQNIKTLLVGNPPYGIMLGDILWDLGAFRPDFRDYIQTGKVYPSQVQTVTANLLSGKEVQFPREVEIYVNDSLMKFVNMR